MDPKKAATEALKQTTFKISENAPAQGPENAPAQASGNAQAMVFKKVPTSTQYVSFPTDPKDAITVVWSEGKHPRTALYYVTKCYWGKLRPGEDPDFSEVGGKSLKVLSQKQNIVVEGAHHM